MRNTWTTEQTEILVKNYAILKNSILSVMLNKTEDQVRHKAKYFKLKKEISCSKSNMSFLEDFDDPEVCYWWGFITADGCINNEQIIIAVHENDVGHLEKFAKKTLSKISTTTITNHAWHKEPYTMARVALNDRFVLERLKKKLSLKSRKTYNPFDINIFCKPENIMFFLAGLIDGDGHISGAPNYSIKIKTHPNWSIKFEEIKNVLKQSFDIDSYITYTKEGWVVFAIYKQQDIKKIYRAIKNMTPYMNRKWDKILQLGV